MAKKSINGILALLMLALLSQPVLADELSDRARLLIEQGQSKEAFQLLEPLEGARSGDPVFDLLFGIAAVDVGQNTRGVFALERVLALQPDNARARAEIGRAYLALESTAEPEMNLKPCVSSRFLRAFRARSIACWPSLSVPKTTPVRAGKAILRGALGLTATSTARPLHVRSRCPVWVWAFSIL